MIKDPMSAYMIDRDTAVLIEKERQAKEQEKKKKADEYAKIIVEIRFIHRAMQGVLRDPSLLFSVTCNEYPLIHFAHIVRDKLIKMREKYPEITKHKLKMFNVYCPDFYNGILVTLHETLSEEPRKELFRYLTAIRLIKWVKWITGLNKTPYDKIQEQFIKLKEKDLLIIEKLNVLRTKVLS